MKVKHGLSIIFTVLFLISLLFADLAAMLVFGITILMIFYFGELKETHPLTEREFKNKYSSSYYEYLNIYYYNE